MENKVTVKECTIFFDKDDYQLRRKPRKQPPIANIVCNEKNIGTIDFGYSGFTVYNIVKKVPVHSSYIGDLYKMMYKYDPETTKHILYNAAISAIYSFMVEDDDTIYMVKAPSHYPWKDDIYNPTGLESFIDAFYAYLKDTYKEELVRDKYIQLNLDNIDKDVLNDIRESVDKDFMNDTYEDDIDEDTKRDLELAEEYEEEDPYNEFEEEDNPAYCKPDDPDKELNARYV